VCLLLRGGLRPFSGRKRTEGPEQGDAGQLRGFEQHLERIFADRIFAARELDAAGVA